MQRKNGNNSARKKNPHHCKSCNHTGSRICPCNHGHLHVFLLKRLVRHFVDLPQRHVSESKPHGSLSPVGVWDLTLKSNMADSGAGDERQNFVPKVEQLPLSGIIPAIEEARRQRPPFVPSVGLPNVIRTPQELMVERVMENCAFKSVLAGVVGMDNCHSMK